jgi:hypothetical protein
LILTFQKEIVYLGWGMIPDGDAQIMVDNHDNQRGHG